ncbi:nucleotide kinase, partial [Candidatus Bathyarchaeota archaeon]
MGKAIVITGTPGVGKSTVASPLSEELGARLIELGPLVAPQGLPEGLDDETG